MYVHVTCDHDPPFGPVARSCWLYIDIVLIGLDRPLADEAMAGGRAVHPS